MARKHWCSECEAAHPAEIEAIHQMADAAYERYHQQMEARHAAYALDRECNGLSEVGEPAPNRD